ncbi:MAG TPA: hypothetical protein PLZ95_01545, partial [Bryobacteraceae bacterium]|nr:hypothetical protein [Bryobacteraceae bacterium]
MNRRELLRRSSQAAIAWTASSYARILGANDRMNLGLIGCGGRGRSVMGTFIETKQVNVTAVCDVFTERVDQAQTAAPGWRPASDFATFS